MFRDAGGEDVRVAMVANVHSVTPVTRLTRRIIGGEVCRRWAPAVAGARSPAGSVRPMSHPHLELTAPRKLPQDGLRVVALGGLGEIGRNMTVFEHAGKLLIVDCGVLFPEEHQPGVDVILPDFTWIRDRLDKIEALVLTHGHEDHIGGVPYLLRERPDIPVVGSRLTLALIEAKLKEHRIKPRLVEVREGDERTFGPFACEFLAVNHSIPDGLAVAIRTARRSRAAHRRLQDGPVPARRPDHRPARLRPARRGRRGPVPHRLHQRGGPRLHHRRAATSPRPSSRSSAPHRAGSSSPASPATCTASSRCSTPRTTHGRKVAFVGRSMVRNMGVAQDLGYLEGPRQPRRAAQAAREAARRQDRPGVHRVARASRWPPCPGWPTASTSIRVGDGDTVLLASSVIPGNENAIYRVINGLTRWGAHVVHKGNAKVHVSGHASAGELVYCYNIVRPSNVCRCTASGGTCAPTPTSPSRPASPPRSVVIAEDGVVVDLVDGHARITGKVPAGNVYVDAMPGRRRHRGSP